LSSEKISGIGIHDIDPISSTVQVSDTTGDQQAFPVPGKNYYSIYK
jgi:hypothetical protein